MGSPFAEAVRHWRIVKEPLMGPMGEGNEKNSG